MTEPDQYFLGHRRAEQDRLDQQAQRLAGEASWLLDQIGLGASARVVDIGCGPRGILDVLSERVGPSGFVVGVEQNEEAVASARKLVADRGLRNVEVRHGDARATGLPRESFDLATARLVLVNVPQPEAVVREAVALTRPGGAVAFHEIDWAAVFCDPPNEAWTALVDLFVIYTKGNGIDLFIGRRVPRLLREAGLVDVRVNPIVHVYPFGHGGRDILLNFAENLSERFLAQRLITEKALADLKESMRRHLEDPDTLVVIGPFIQAWGRKPAQ